MVFCFKSLHLQGRLLETVLIWPFLLLFLPSAVGPVACVHTHVHPTY